MACARTPVSQGAVQGVALLILVTLGTHEQPFRRALDLAATLAEIDEVVVQHGHTDDRLAFAAKALAFVDPDELARLMREASAVVCHAGVGTIMTALAQGKTPVVVPRLRELGEHVDDHQLQISRAFAAEGYVIVVLPGDDVVAAVRRAVDTPPMSRQGSRELHSAVAGALSRPPRRRWATSRRLLRHERA